MFKDKSGVIKIYDESGLIKIHESKWFIKFKEDSGVRKCMDARGVNKNQGWNKGYKNARMKVESTNFMDEIGVAKM